MLSLTVMALLVLVVLTVAGFLNLESRLSSAALSHTRARMNAVTAARLALGQLQQLAGHDQRVTARADVLDPAATGSANNTYLKLTTLNDQRRWWTGVWVTGGANGTKLRDWDPANPDTRLFAGWLVSPQGTDQVLGATVASNLTGALSNGIVKQLEVASNGTRGRITLLGGESLPAGTTLANGRVESDVAAFPAPLNSSANCGGYAWWTADEGVKARVNLSDPLAAKGSSIASRVESLGVNDWWRGFAGVALGRVGVELAGTTSGDTASVPNRPTAFLPGHQASREAAIDATKAWTENPILRVFSREEFQAWLNATARTELDAATKAASIAGLSRGWHDLTVSSRGVLSNQLDGGLKVDLSVAFELPFATSGTTKGWQDLAWFHQSPDSNSLNLASDVRAGVAGTAISSATDPQSEEWNITGYKLGFVYEIVIPSEERNGRGDGTYLLRGPTWDLLRNHYRLYKREREAYTPPSATSMQLTPTAETFTKCFTSNADAWLARGSEPYTFVQGAPRSMQTATAPSALAGTSPGIFGTKGNLAAMQPVLSAGTANYRHQYTMNLVSGFSTPINTTGDRAFETRSRLAPHIVRVGMAHSLIYVYNAVVIGIDPFVVLHNPYNVPIEFAGIGINWAQFNNTRYNIHRADTPGAPVAYCTLGQDLAQRSFSYRMFGTNPPGAWKQAPQGNFRMLPGETQIVTPNINKDRWQVPRDRENTNSCMGTFLGYDLQSNFRISSYRLSDGRRLADYASTQADIDAMVAPPLGASYTSEPLFVRMTISDQSQYNAFQAYLFRPNRYGSSSNGSQSVDLGYRAWLGNNLNPYADCSDEHLLQQVSFRARPSNITGSETAGEIKSIPFNRYPQYDAVNVYGNLNKNFFAITDLRLRSAAEANGFPMPTLALNPRAQLADPRNLDNSADTSPAWTVQIRPTSTDPSLSEFQMWPGPPTGLGRSLVPWGNSFVPSGLSPAPVILFQVPTRPLLSLAQLAHADISQLDIDPAYAVGNSYALPWLDSLDKIVHWPATSTNALERIDVSYAANLGLWDRTFFSGFNAGTAKAPTTGTNPATGKAYDGTGQPYATITAAVDALFLGATDVLANRRMTWSRFPKATATAGDALLKAEFVKPEQTAKQLVNEGAFNVNSTSVAAWKAQLASGFQALANGTSNIPDYPFGRMQPPTGESVDITGSGNTNRWNTFRSLKESDGTLTKLAEAIVAEVRARGPFMSLSDFVNRRLVTDRNGQKGALQAAIDAVTPAINTSVNATQIGSSALSRIPQAAALSPSGSGAETPLPLGRPDQLLQSDVLAALGPALAARSDTFVIRAYGSDGDSRGAVGQAWCEITVQRLPEWVVPSAEDLNTADSTYRSTAVSTKGATVDTLKRNTALGAVNRQLGRRFAIVSFRWVPSPTQ